MTTLGQDKYDHGYADGEDNGIRIGTEEGIRIGTERGIKTGTINTAVEGVLIYMEDTGRSVDEALSRFPIPEEYRSEVESEVRKRLLQ